MAQVLVHRHAAVYLPAFPTAPFIHGCTPVPPSFPHWSRYSYIDVLRYAWGALMKNQFGGDLNVEASGRLGTLLPCFVLLNWSALGWLD